MITNLECFVANIGNDFLIKSHYFFRVLFLYVFYFIYLCIVLG
jgi:hypothetical protein